MQYQATGTRSWQSGFAGQSANNFERSSRAERGYSEPVHRHSDGLRAMTSTSSPRTVSIKHRVSLAHRINRAGQSRSRAACFRLFRCRRISRPPARRPTAESFAATVARSQSRSRPASAASRSALFDPHVRATPQTASTTARRRRRRRSARHWRTSTARRLRRRCRSSPGCTTTSWLSRPVAARFSRPGQGGVERLPGPGCWPGPASRPRSVVPGRAGGRRSRRVRFAAGEGFVARQSGPVH